MNPRTAREVIDQAIRENRFNEWLLYLFATIFVVTGLILIGVSVTSESPLAGALGGVSSVLFFPAMHLARRTRQENIAIRLLEVVIAQSDSSKDAAEALRIVVDRFTLDRGNGKKFP